MGNGAVGVGGVVDEVYRSESRRVLATLIHLLGDFDWAEEAMHDAFAAAVEQWPQKGVPANPRAWLVSTGRFKAIDAMRRRARFDTSLDDLPQQPSGPAFEPEEWDEQSVEDDRLRLIFTCCHPALPPDAQIALTLREVCGLTTEEIARAFLAGAPTIAKRIVRAKAKIRDARIPYEVPSRSDLATRLDAVLQVIYLVFTEGYSASSGESLTRADLSGEAIRLGRLLVAVIAGAGSAGTTGDDAVARIAPRYAYLARRASWCCWTIRTDRSGIGISSMRVFRWLSLHSRRALSARIRCRQRSRRCMPVRPRRPRRTGHGSLNFTICCRERVLRRWWS